MKDGMFQYFYDEGEKISEKGYSKIFNGLYLLNQYLFFPVGCLRIAEYLPFAPNHYLIH